MQQRNIAAGISHKRKRAGSADGPKEIGAASLNAFRKIIMRGRRSADLPFPLRLKRKESNSRDIGLLHGRQIKIAYHSVGPRAAVRLLERNPRAHLSGIKPQKSLH